LELSEQKDRFARTRVIRNLRDKIQLLRPQAATFVAWSLDRRVGSAIGDGATEDR
jgi:hypothetical protein